MKPIIGITTFCESKPKKVYSSVSYNYVKSVQLAGGTPVLIPLVEDEEDLDNYLDKIDGLILTGGEDMNPLSYGENPIKEVTFISIERDEQEIKLYLKAVEKHIPILGICRGAQVINVAAGGTLYQDIPVQIKDALGHCPLENPVYNLYHTVEIYKNSKLFQIFVDSNLKVNSFHHQSIKELGKDLNVTAVSIDGIIEGIEHKLEPFIVGVQWHPEDLTVHHPKFIKLFSALINACSKI